MRLVLNLQHLRLGISYKIDGQLMRRLLNSQTDLDIKNLSRGRDSRITKYESQSAEHHLQPEERTSYILPITDTTPKLPIIENLSHFRVPKIQAEMFPP